MRYFYDYFARAYKESRRGELLSAPAAMFQGIRPEEVQQCRKILKNSFAGYREGRNADVLKRLLGEYQKYVSSCYDKQAKDRYNAFVYQYMLEIHVGSRAIAAKMGVTRETILSYVYRCIDEMLMLCMGIPAVVVMPENGEAAVRMLVDGSRLFSALAGYYVLCLFPGKRERAAVEQGRKFTRRVMVQLADAVKAYSDYCNDSSIRIDTDIRKAEILEKCLDGIPPAAIARGYGCCESTIYADIRENERRLAAMLFEV